MHRHTFVLEQDTARLEIHRIEVPGRVTHKQEVVFQRGGKNADRALVLGSDLPLMYVARILFARLINADHAIFRAHDHRGHQCTGFCLVRRRHKGDGTD